MPKTKLDIIDEIANGTGFPLKDEEVSVVLFGSGIIKETFQPPSWIFRRLRNWGL